MRGVAGKFLRLRSGCMGSQGTLTLETKGPMALRPPSGDENN